MSVITLTNVTCAFPSIIKPYISKQRREAGDTEGRFTCDFIFPPGDAGYTEFQSSYRELALAKWGKRADQIMEQIHGDRKARCYGEGKQKFKKDTGQVLEGYEGNFFLTASNRHRPQLADSTGRVVDPFNTMAFQQEAGKVYSGCKVNAFISVWLQDHETAGYGVRLNFLGIQFAGEGQRFGDGGAPDVSGMFGKVAIAEPEGGAVSMPTTKMPWE